MSPRPKSVSRTRYHHGDLRNALSGAALELARGGGPEAVVLREAARRVGVSATAAYRHFNSQADLLDEVKNQALNELARAIEQDLGKCEEGAGPGELAVARVRSAAHAYLEFAFSEPGLYNAAFCRGRRPESTDGPQDEPDVQFAETSAFVLLGELLDGLVAAGRMTAERRPMAEIAVWSGVHGLALLFIEGPLRQVAGEERAAAIDYSIDTIIRGLAAE
jgi:AcrR family transcriptional regulator